MSDETEMMRRAMLQDQMPEQHLAEVFANNEPVWNTEELKRDFEVVRFLAPFVEVRRRSDGKEGIMEFTHLPRWYFRWETIK